MTWIAARSTVAGECFKIPLVSVCGAHKITFILQYHFLSMLQAPVNAFTQYNKKYI